MGSLANIRYGEPITDTFQTKSDNTNRIYVVRWFIDGKYRYVSTDDWVPGSGNSPSFAKTVNNN